MTTNETYIARLRKLIAEAPDGLDVGPLEVALASAEAALASSDSTGDRTKIWFLLDRSGSMGYLTDDVIGGFNEFLKQQMPSRGRPGCRSSCSTARIPTRWWSTAAASPRFRR